MLLYFQNADRFPEAQFHIMNNFILITTNLMILRLVEYVVILSIKL